MRYRKYTISLVVSDDESEIAAQVLTDALERLRDVQCVTLYDIEWEEADVPEPEDAAEARTATD